MIWEGFLFLRLCSVVRHRYGNVFFWRLNRKHLNMETNKILDADILDLLFDGRNKEYGAYDLRKHYNGRLGRAIAVMSGVVVLVCCFSFVKGHGKTVASPMVTDVVMEALPTERTPPVVPPPPVVKTPPPVATRIFTAPKLVEQDVPDNEKPPVNDDLDHVRIGDVNTPGGDDVGVVTGPVSDGASKGIVEKPKQAEDDGPVIGVQIEAQYPGGMPAWARFLNKNLRYPDEAQGADIFGTVVVQFIVDKEGNVSDVVAVSGPTEGGLREEAVRVIRKSGKWTPAIQNGRQVKSYKKQPIIFEIAEQ